MSSTIPPDYLAAGGLLPHEVRKSELSIATARASVMVYDDVSKKWAPSGTSSGVSKVQIYHHQLNNTFRVVGRKLHDHEVVINCAILKGLKYNQATNTFHQWRDNKQVYGLNFSSKEDADAFSRTMFQCIDALSGQSRPPAPPPQPPQMGAMNLGNPPATQGIYQQSNGQYEEDMGYSLLDRTMTREDVAIIQERRMSQQQQLINTLAGSPNNAPPPPAHPSSGHHRTSSAPPAPQPPPMALAPLPSHQQPPQQQQSSPMSSASSSSVGGGVPSPSPPQPPPVPQHGPPAPPPLAPPAPPAPPPWSGGGMVGMGAPNPPPVPGGGGGPVPPPMPAMSGGMGMAVPAAAPAPSPAPPPPPPVPNMSRSSSSDGPETYSLASALQNARLRRANKQGNIPSPFPSQSTENSGSSTSSSGSSNYGTLGRGGGAGGGGGGSGMGMASMMDEMAKTLARRRAAAEKQDCSRIGDVQQDVDNGQDKKPWEKGQTGGGGTSNGTKFSNGGSDGSPKPSRKRFGSASEESGRSVAGGEGSQAAGCAMPGSPIDIENLKQDILKEMRKELGRMKQDIIDAIKMELNRR